MKILVVDDEYDIRNLIKLYLMNEFYTVIEAANGIEALEIIHADTENSIDLVLLDSMMPEMDGIEACLEIRKTKNLPIILLTAKSEDLDKYTGFSSGADDYITKPFNPIDLISRVKANIRRYRSYSENTPSENTSSPQKSDEIILGDLIVNFAARTVVKNNKEIKLTKIEFSILELFFKNRKRVYSLEDIYSKVWGMDNILNAESTVSVHIKNLRNKIEDDRTNPKYIKTVWGAGYRVD